MAHQLVQQAVQAEKSIANFVQPVDLRPPESS
jgi:hypothetical protein